MALQNKNINEILTDIERDRIALPDMQRDFVWDNTQVRDLVDSLYRNHPVGMVLVWQTDPDDVVPITRIDDSRKENSSYSELVIDGQQRLTSLYLVKHGSIYKGGKERKIKLLFNPQDQLFEVEIPRIKNRPDWVSVTELIRDGEYKYRDQLKALGWPEDKIFQAMQKMSEVRNIFMGARNSIPVFSVGSQLQYDEVADIFVKINSKGTRIRITELLMALLALKVPGEFRAQFRQFLDKLEDEGWEIDPGIVIRSLVAVSAKQGRLAYFRGLAKSISKDDLKKNWAIVEKALPECLRMLDENLGIRTADILPSEYVLIPLTYYLSIKDGPFSEAETREFTLWFLLASYWGRYAGSPETRLDEDIRTITEQKSLKGLFAHLKNQVGRLLIEEERFVGRSRNSMLLLYVVSRANGAEDWWKGHKITTTDYEAHHVFPRSLLKKAQYEVPVIDDVANMAFLTEKANRKISNSQPGTYLAKIDQGKLQKQFVPIGDGLWDIAKYEDFLKARRRLIVEAVNAHLKSLGIEQHL